MTMQRCAKRSAAVLGSPWAGLFSLAMVVITPLAALLWGWTIALLLLTTTLTVKTQLQTDLTLFLEWDRTDDTESE